MNRRHHEAAVLHSRAMKVKCPYCGAEPGAYCTGTKSGRHHFARLSALVFVSVALVACGDDMKPPLPPCPDGNHLCNRSGVCTVDGKQCQLAPVDGGAP